MKKVTEKQVSQRRDSVAEGHFSSAPCSGSQKLFTRCGLQHKGVFGQFTLILVQSRSRARNATSHTMNSLIDRQHEA